MRSSRKQRAILLGALTHESGVQPRHPERRSVFSLARRFPRSLSSAAIPAPGTDFVPIKPLNPTPPSQT